MRRSKALTPPEFGSSANRGGSGLAQELEFWAFENIRAEKEMVIAEREKTLLDFVVHKEDDDGIAGTGMGIRAATEVWGVESVDIGMANFIIVIFAIVFPYAIYNKYERKKLILMGYETSG